jgi:omega-hydroxy-beta-dihydromenaquinone-9 sulfotransferase
LIAEMSFPRTGGYYQQFLTLRDATPAEIELWKSCLMWFLRKLTVKHGRPLVLKSPGHTARIKLLLELFPQAKFIHIHRHPHAVFQSSLHTMKKSTPFWALQKYKPDIERIIQDYVDVYDAFFEQRGLIPAENFCEIGFDQLEQNPIAEVQRIYRELRLPEFECVEPKLRQYVQSLDGYSRNSFPELPSDVRKRLGREWGRCFEEWEYDR